MKKEIIVGILIDPPKIFIDVDEKLRGLLIDIWEFIENKLKNKYNFKRINIYDSEGNIQKYLEKLEKKEYDILIGSFWLNNLKNTETIFTFPLLISSPLLVYNGSIYKGIILKDYLIDLVKIWYKPLLLIMIFLLSMYIYKIVNNINHDLLFSLELFFAQKDLLGLQDDKLFIIFIIIKFFLFIYILSIVVSKTVEYYSKSNLIDKNIKGKKIYIKKEDYSLIKSRGGIPIIVDDPLQSYLENQYKKDVIGYVYSSLSINKAINKYKYLIISEAIKNINQNILPINKHNTELLKDINDIIFFMNNQGLINKFCKNININNNEINC